MEAKDREEKMIDEKQEVEKAKSDQDLRIGSVVELEDGKSYVVDSVYEEDRSNNPRITLVFDESAKEAKAKLSYGQVVSCYGAMRRVCAVKMTGWGKPHVELKAVVNCGR